MLTSIHSRTTKALDKDNLITPPILPLRVDPSSEEARLLGPFSKRREVNIRWRYFKRESRKILPPLQLSVKEISDSFEVTKTSSDVHDIASVGIRGIGLQASRLVEEAQILAGPAWKSLSIPRRAREKAESQTPQLPNDNPFNSSLPTRWLRKRYQDLLGRVPILTYSYKKSLDESGNHRGWYEVSLAPSAISSHIRYGAHRLPPADDSALSWIQRAKKQEGKPESPKQTRKQDTMQMIVNK